MGKPRGDVLSPSASLRSRAWIAPDLAHDVLLAPRHRESLGDTAQQNLPVGVAVGGDASLETANGVSCHQAVTVYAHETGAELVFEASQRFFEQIFTVGG